MFYWPWTDQLEKIKRIMQKKKLVFTLVIESSIFFERESVTEL